MEQRTICVGTVSRASLTRRSRAGRSARRVRGGAMCLGLLGVLITEGIGVAQTPPTESPPVPGPLPLTVRPREMATGTRTPQAGEYPLDSLKDYVVYVPPKCVGTQRCPLVVFLHPGATDSKYVIERERPVADKYGTIILAPNSPTTFFHPQAPAADQYRTASNLDQKRIDAAMKQVLRKFAIDPDKIALIGYSASVSPMIVLGGHSLDVFSRIIVVSGGYALSAGVDPRNTTTEFLLDAGFLESRGNFLNVQELRQAGHPVQQFVGLRDHGMEAQHYDLLGHWLHESWAKPNPATRPAPSVVTDSMPLLTPAVLRTMTAFWTSFQREPDSIRRTARLAHLREVTVPIGAERPSVLMVDMPALAAKYPSVAAALTAAGLTAQEHEAYRVALISAKVAKTSREPMKGMFGEEYKVKGASPPLEPGSVQAKNLEFLNAHPEEFGALGKTNMWYTD